MRLAVLAHHDGGAFNTVIVTSSSVNRASLIGNVGVVHEFESRQGIASVASHVILITRDHDLGRDVDVWPGSLPCDLDSVRQRRCGGLSPAGSTVLGNMLVLDVGKIVDSVHVVPDPVVRKGLRFKRLVDF
jgi:hypothetical protein